MAKKIALTKLQASTLDIINTIRQQASAEYQALVPKAARITDIPAVGEVVCGNPTLSNQFINSLVNRITFVVVRSAIFNNRYKKLKKGEFEYGETIEEIFVEIAQVLNYDPEEAANREFKRYIPDVRSAYHVINWRVVYPITIQYEDLKAAFLSENGMESLITKIIDSVYRAAEYDEFLLFKYLLIKAVSHGKMYPVAVGNTDVSTTDAAIAFRSIGNKFSFMRREFNLAGVRNNVPDGKLAIFMDTDFNATFDVKELAAAFNMDKADFIGSLFLIDDWTTFDNERFAEIRSKSTGLEEVTEAELTLMKNVAAISLDEDWFQFYDNYDRLKEKDVASGDYWNYFYHVRKTISSSPFSNAVVFVKGNPIAAPASFDATVDTITKSKSGTTVITFETPTTVSFASQDLKYAQTQALTTAGIAVKPYGALMVPDDQKATDITLEAVAGGVKYKAGETLTSSTVAIGDVITLTKEP